MARPALTALLSLWISASSLTSAGGTASVRVEYPDFSIRGYVEQEIARFDMIGVEAGVFFRIDSSGVQYSPYSALTLYGEQWLIQIGFSPSTGQAFITGAFTW